MGAIRLQSWRHFSELLISNCNVYRRRFNQRTAVLELLRKSSTQVGILGAPFNKGQSKSGVEFGPSAIRESGLAAELAEFDIDVKDYGDLKFSYYDEEHVPKGPKFPKTVAKACQKVSEGVMKVLLDDRICVTLGGDHSLSLGSIHGHSLVHDVCVLWIDAHSDINTEESSFSGNMHGMPCAFLVKEILKHRFSPHKELQLLKPCLSSCNLAYIGLRAIDPYEKFLLLNENILHFGMQDIDEYGIQYIIHQALAHINPTGDLSLHVSFDIDSIDSLLAPSTGTPVMGGLTIREAVCIAEEVSQKTTLRAIDVMEVNPHIGSAEDVEQTVNIAKLVLKTLLGYKRQGRLPKDSSEMP